MIKLQNISWTVPEGSRVLRDVSLELPENKLIAISGPNGGGKTTLARVLMGLEKPTSGRIFLDDKDITDMSVTERAHEGLSFAFQQPVRFKGITVRRLLCLAAGKDLTEESLCVLLHKVGLCAKNYLDRDIDSTLSGGEIKRIEIASVLARDTKYVIFDEPEAGIDLWSFESLIGVFEDMRRLDKTLITITHQERILQIADEIIIIADGRVEDRGPGPAMMSKMMGGHHCVHHCCGRTEDSRE